jgi:alpha-galactosidase
MKFLQALQRRFVWLAALGVLASTLAGQLTPGKAAEPAPPTVNTGTINTGAGMNKDSILNLTFQRWAEKPPMGWNSWDCFGTTVTEAQTKTLKDKRIMTLLFAAAIIGSANAATTSQNSITMWLDELELGVASQGWGKPMKNKSVDGKALSIGGKVFERGFGTHAESYLRIQLNGEAQKFSAQVGVGDEVRGQPASVEFVVFGDDKELWKSGVMRAGDAAKECSVDLTGVKLLELLVTDGGNGIAYDHANWADAKIEAATAKKFATSSMAAVAPYILTPPAPATPRINGASVFGVRPGSPFLFMVPATGDRPMRFSATGLPPGLTMDAQTGRITGKIAKADTYVVTLHAKNARGEAQKKLRIVCGDRIALTPPMGWNSWNVFAHAVSADKVKRAADAMVKSGLINHGWSYINIDDFWQNHRNSSDPTLRGRFRDETGNIVPNQRFSDMKGLVDYIHGLGLKAGLYSSPGPWTCGGCEGSFGHEKQDAETYAKWGFDYLKYDWCSYGGLTQGKQATDPNLPSFAIGQGEKDLEVAKRPYQVMGQFLREQPRDIVYSLCQYGMSEVWKWGDSVNGQAWRTTHDIRDTWQSMRGIALAQDKAAPWAKPGNWNDPDMLILGHVGWGNPHPTRLTPDEQYLHMSLWSLFSAPLLIGCDMEKLDDFTLNLLTNDEVIAINQDALGKQATCVHTVGDVRIYVKQLEDGGRAVGFCNFGIQAAMLEYKEFSKLGLSGRQRVRDLWRQKDLATLDTASQALSLTIPAHGVVLYKFTSS